jgi:gamma-D-glutamyl-L-lysine dipeptidyl-peptidase
MIHFAMLLTSLLHYYVQVPSAPLYDSPQENAHIVSEAIFAEELTVVELLDEWAVVKSGLDEPHLFVHKQQLFEREKSYADCTCNAPMVEVSGQQAALYATKSATQAPLLILPFECRLEAEDPSTQAEWLEIKLPDGAACYVQKKEITSELLPKSKEQLISFSKNFLQIPFKEAGTTSFGFDSSGFIQMLYRQMGISLPRTLQAQCAYSELEDAPIDTLEPGDLIFWGSCKEKIEHVAMLLDNQQCIHVSKDTGIEITPLHSASALPVRMGRRLR